MYTNFGNYQPNCVLDFTDFIHMQLTAGYKGLILGDWLEALTFCGYSLFPTIKVKLL
jgi:hypothetical protein